MDNIQLKIYDKLCELSGEEVANIFTNYYGLQALNEDFAKHVAEELELDYVEMGLEDD